MHEAYAYTWDPWPEYPDAGHEDPRLFVLRKYRPYVHRGDGLGRQRSHHYGYSGPDGCMESNYNWVYAKTRKGCVRISLTEIWRALAAELQPQQLALF